MKIKCHLAKSRWIANSFLTCILLAASAAHSQTSWNFNGTNHDWEASNHSTAEAGESFVTYEIAGKSPYPNFGTTGASINTDDFKYVSIKIQNLSPNERLQLVLNRNSDLKTQYIPFNGLSGNDTEFKTYKLNLGKNRAWKGIVKDITLRFRKNVADGEGVTAGTVLIDHIEFLREGEEMSESSESSSINRVAKLDDDKKPLNFIHIIMDDLRTEGLKAYDDDEAVTPNIDRLAREGVVYKKAFANFPSCGASRASFLTGLRPTPTRFTRYDARIDEDAPGIRTLPHYLKENGYITVSLGKIIHRRGDTDDAWSIPPWDAKYMEGNRSSYMNYSKEENVEAYITSCKKRKICSPSGSGKGPAYEWNDVPDNQYIDGKTAIAAIETLEQLKAADMPFYIAVGFVKPHLPFAAPQKYWDLYDRDKIEFSPIPDKPKDAPNQAWHQSGELREWYDGIPDVPSRWVDNVPPETARILRHGYYASTSYADAQMGKVLDALDRLDLSDNTVVIFTGDHGFSLGDHTLWNKHSLFTLATQSPLIIRKPGGEKNKSVPGVVEYLDIYPTVTELANLPTPDHLEGESLVETLEDADSLTKPAVYTRYHAGENIHTDRYSYSAWFSGGRITEHMLYDHENDPLETVNLVNDPEYKSVMRDLQKRLKAHIKKRDRRAARLL